MNRQQLAHILRSACRITDDEDVLVLGSQSILGSFDEDDLPPQATASIEADISFLDDPYRDKADQVEAIIGEMSGFHTDNGGPYPRILDTGCDYAAGCSVAVRPVS